MTKIGIIKEGKIPVDRRVALTPIHCKLLKSKYPDVDIVVQPSPIRAFTDTEYTGQNIELQNDLSDCDVIFGVKEVNIEDLIPNKTYFFFSHTTKKQPYNQKLLQSILSKNIHLIDYEHLTNTKHQRVVAFGRYAGIVGAYNGLIAYGKRTNRFDLKPAHNCFDMVEMLNEVKDANFEPNTKILITGKGRVGMGAMETLSPLNIKTVNAYDFLNKTYSEPVICQIDADNYVKRKDGKKFDFQDFFKNPEAYESTFLPFTKVTDIYIASHFWNPKSPVFMTPIDYKAKDFNIKVIADISCDIGGPIPSTLRPSTIDKPLYGYNREQQTEGEPFADENVTVMAVDNLPCELPRDASNAFGNDLIKYVIPNLLGSDAENMILNASITKEGKLTKKYEYLEDFAKGK